MKEQTALELVGAARSSPLWTYVGKRQALFFFFFALIFLNFWIAKILIVGDSIKNQDFLFASYNETVQKSRIHIHTWYQWGRDEESLCLW